MKLPPLSIGGSQNKVASDPETETVRFLGIPGPRVAMVVVVDDVVDPTEIRARPTMSGWPLTGPNILGNHWPVGPSGETKNRNVYVRSRLFPLPVAVAPVQPGPSGHEEDSGQSLAPTVELESRPPKGSRTRTVQYTALLLILLCSTMEFFDRESDSRLGLPVAIVVVVVVLVVVVVEGPIFTSPD